MFIELEPIFNNVGSSLNLDYSFNLEGVESIFTKPVKVVGEVKNNTGIVSLKGVATTTVTVSCDRCADEFSRGESYPFSHLLISELNEQDNDDYILVENMRLDLDELIREDVILSLPTQFLCKDDCKGLCYICGQNLNIKQCGCKKPIDPRLAALQQLLD